MFDCVFCSRPSYIRVKREKIEWSKSARKSIRQSGLTEFAKIANQGDVNHSEFEDQHQDYVEALLAVKPSAIPAAGQGVFLKSDIKKGTFLGFYAGEQVCSDSQLSADKSSYVFNTSHDDILINGHPDDGGGILSRVNSPSTYGVFDDLIA